MESTVFSVDDSVRVKRGSVPRALYDFNPERILQFGFTLYRLALARRAVVEELRRHELPREELVRMGDVAFQRYATRTKLLVESSLVQDLAAVLAEEGISLENVELRQATRIVRGYEAVLEKYESDPFSVEGMFARKVREAAYAYAEGMLSAKRDKDEDKLTAWDVRMQGSKAKDLLAGAIGFLRGGAVTLGVSGVSALVAHFAVISVPELTPHTALLAQVGVGVFSFAITAFVMLFLSGRGIESVDQRWRLAVKEAGERQEVANERTREIALGVALAAWTDFTGEEFDVERGLLSLLRRPSREKVNARFPDGAIGMMRRVRLYWSHRTEFKRALMEVEGRLRTQKQTLLRAMNRS